VKDENNLLNLAGHYPVKILFPNQILVRRKLQAVPALAHKIMQSTSTKTSSNLTGPATCK